jgi:PAS domain S-box-containing protein
VQSDHDRLGKEILNMRQQSINKDCQSSLGQLSGVERDQFLEALFNGSSDLMMALAADYTLKLINRSFLEATGLSSESVIGNSWKTVFPGLHKQLEHLFHKSRISGQTTRSGFSFQLPDQSGQGVSYWRAEVHPLSYEEEFGGWIVEFKEAVKPVWELARKTGAEIVAAATAEPLHADTQDYGNARPADRSESAVAKQDLVTPGNILQALAGLTPFGIWECNRDGELIYASDNLMAATGLVWEECLGFGWSQLLLPQEAERVLEQWKKAFTRQTEWSLEYTTKDPGGQIREISCQALPLRDDEGKLSSWMVLNWEITGYKRETASRAKEAAVWKQFFRTFAEHTAIGMAVLTGVDSALKWSNPYYQRFLTAAGCGAAKDESGAGPGLPDTGGKLEGVLAEVRATRKPVLNVEVRLDTPENPDSLWECAVFPLADTDENDIDIMVTATPISQRTAETGASGATEAKWREAEAVIDNLAEGLVIVDQEGRAVRLNSKALELLGIPAPERKEGESAPPVDWKGFKFLSIDGTELKQDEWPHMKVLRGEYLDKYDLEIRSDHDQGLRYLSFSGAPLRDGEGRNHMAVLTFRDITDKKEISREKERLLNENRRQRQFLERLLETVSFGIAVVRGTDYRFELVNHGGIPVFGPPEAVVAKKVTEVLPEDAATKMVKALDEVYRTGRTVRVSESERKKRPNRKELHWEFEYVPLKNDEGSVEGILVIVTDITARVSGKKRAETLTAVMMELNAATNMYEILRASIRCSAQALNANDGSIFLFSGEGGHCEGVFELWSDDGSTRNININEMPNTKLALDTKKPVYFTPTQAAGQETVWFRQSGMWGCLAIPLLVNDETIGLLSLHYYWQEYGIVEEEMEFAASIGNKCAVVIDRVQTQLERSRLLVSERRARTQAERQAAEMSALLQSLKEGVLVIDAAGRIVLRNQMERILSNVGDEEAVSIDNYGDFELLWPDGTPVPRNLLPGNRLLRGETLNDTEFILERSDGSRLQIISNGGIVRGEDGEVALAIIISRDVTQMRLLEEVREDFIRAVSHDLRNPLTVVSARSQLLQRRLLKQGKNNEAEDAGIIYTSARRMAQMIQEMFDSYRLESSNFILNKNDMDLAALLRDLVARVGTNDDMGRIKLRVAEGDFRIFADQERLERAVVNLITNALKYSPEDQPVEITLSSDGDQAIISVMDYGIGIAPQDLPKVFQRYYRAKTVKDSMGLGLGLHIVKLIVEAHGGSVEAESELNLGSIFRIILPYHPEPAESS